MRPWLDEIRRIVRDPAYYQELCAAARAEAANHDIQRSTDRFIEAVTPVINASRGKAVLAKPAPTMHTAAASDLASALEKKKRAQAASRGARVKKKA